MPSISVILPTYNRAHTLKRALESVLNQSYEPLEVIVVDDGSTDDTASVLADYPKVIYIFLDGNQGASRARNVGISEAKGEYLAFQDSDDCWALNKLAEQVEFLDKHPETGLLCTGISVFGRDGNLHEYPGTNRSTDPNAWTFNEFQTYPFSTPTWLIKKQLLVDVGMFDESLPNCEDLDLLARLLPVSVIHMLPQILTVKYNQADSLDANLFKLEESYAHLFSRHKSLWMKTPEALVRSYRRLANLYMQTGYTSKARRALIQALTISPFSFKGWLLFILALTGQKAYALIHGLRGR